MIKIKNKTKLYNKKENSLARVKLGRSHGIEGRLLENFATLPNTIIFKVSFS